MHDGRPLHYSAVHGHGLVTDDMGDHAGPSDRCNLSSWIGIANIHTSHAIAGTVHFFSLQWSGIMGWYHFLNSSLWFSCISVFTTCFYFIFYTVLYFLWKYIDNLVSSAPLIYDGPAIKCLLSQWKGDMKNALWNWFRIVLFYFSVCFGLTKREHILENLFWRDIHPQFMLERSNLNVTFVMLLLLKKLV